jgi:hypothetical protein
MKIERKNAPDLSEVVRDGIEALVRGRPAPKTDEERLLAHRDKKRRSFRGHWHAYVSVMGGLGIMNLVTWLLVGIPFPWVLFPVAMWGMGFGIHGLNYRAWVKDNASAVMAAESALGLLPPGQPNFQLEAGPLELDPWQQLIQECRTAVTRTGEALSSLDHPAQDIDGTIAHLDEGLEKIERLAEGAARIDHALAEISPGGFEVLQQSIEDVEASINGASDSALREVYHANRTLLVARKAKVQALLSDRERMMANAKGFLLATQNLRLDTARIGSDELGKSSQLTAPLERLSEEVEILRKVESELSRL